MLGQPEKLLLVFFSALFGADAIRQQCRAPARSRTAASLHAEAAGLLPPDRLLIAILLAGPHGAAAQGEGQWAQW